MPMPLLWRTSNGFPTTLYGSYDRAESPDRFLFFESAPLKALASAPTFRFRATSARVAKWDVLGNDAGLQLVGERVLEILRRLAPGDFESFAASALTKDGRLQGYEVLNITCAINAIDHEESEYSYVLDTDQIGGFRRLRFLADCMGRHQIARDAQYFPHILVGDAVSDAFRQSKIRGVDLISDTEFLG